MGRDRRALTRVGGPVETRGDPAAARALAHALRVRPGDGDRATIGFHPWPARMHPETAARLVVAFAPEGGAVADPMCGSGTVCVAALCGGHPAMGLDLSPVAVEVASVATWVAPAPARRAVAERGRSLARAAYGRFQGAVEPPPRDAGHVRPFAPGTYAELSCLAALIGKEPDPVLRRAFRVAFSALLTRFADRESETATRPTGRRHAPGATFRAFADKCRELALRLAHLAHAVPRPAPPVTVAVGDARDCAGIGDGTVALVCTSPPYPNTYDYAAIHADRAAWLGYDVAPFARGEIGARREFARDRGAADRWRADVRATVATMARILRPGGHAVLMVGDAGVEGRLLRHDAAVHDAAGAARLAVVAQASQVRETVGARMRRDLGAAVKREHLMLLHKS